MRWKLSWRVGGGERPLLDVVDAAVIHVGDPVAEMEDPIVMCHDHHGPIGTDRRLAEQFHDCEPRFVVEGGSRLVADQEPGLMDQRSGDRHPLHLSAREFTGKAAELITHSQVGERHRWLASRLGSLDQPAITRGMAAFSAADSAGRRLYCWKTKPMFLARNRVSARSLIAFNSCPKMETEPLSQSRIPAMTDSSVVLPHPDGPTISDNLAGIDIPVDAAQAHARSDRRDPKCLVTPANPDSHFPLPAWSEWRHRRNGLHGGVVTPSTRALAGWVNTHRH